MSVLVFAQSNEENIRTVIENVRELFQSPVALLGLLGGVGLFIYAWLTREGWRLAFIGTLLLAMLVDGSDEFFNNTLFPPLQQIRGSSQFTAVAALGLLVLATLKFGRPGWSRIAGGVAVAFLVFELYYSVRLVISEQFLRGSLSIITFLLIFMAIPMGIGRTLDEPDRIERLIRTFGLVAIPYVILNILQYGYAPNYTIVSGRFAGISGNPQHAAMMLSFLVVTLAWILSRPRGNWIVLPAFAGVIGLGVLLMAWTGSRTGAISAVVGIALIFRRRALSLLLVGGFTVITGIVAASILGEGTEAFERVTSTDNTRQEVWMTGLAEFTNRPIFGTLGDPNAADVKVVESTPIQTLQVLGCSGFIPMLAIYGGIVFSIYRLQRVRQARPDLRAIVDYVVAMWCMVLVMSLTEAIFLGILTFFNLTIYTVATLTAALLAQEYRGVPEDEFDDEFDDGDPEDYGEDGAVVEGAPAST
ncbi:MAG: hypothetical protein VX012_01965 [Planctomycetota bacterium]|nr:hypothetical protein [Planctomycetota bacterium]